MFIKERVDQLVKKHNTNNPFKIAEELGIQIVYEQLGSILGYYSKTHRCKVIHINESSPREQQIFTCCHELGHALQHPEHNTAFLKANTFYSTDKIEQEANEFAIELLFNQGGDQIVTLREATETYGISEQLVYKNFCD
ncbi:ImmA/IrrE family metallo-endopeptidase [Gracilibacillus salinarum]|uniref:ImmA/IrrE family metallo-endopeptidase n=1 Tax=Gracilibacillus salinarum TaxID=2932255 RepID=A0ABY4GN83_9BACI|nr:ImmA/IrrE family metallo-endopeptidase [Gracilibacillus salinarum]UOQ85656.1 ImmA/IrrE family metallo-endopeptidase [Gracilibacillus salinarum]